MITNHAPPQSILVTDFRTAKAGDVLDRGKAAVKYRYLLLSRPPVYRADGLWTVAGRRWMFSRQAFAQKCLSFRCDGPEG